MYDDQPIVDAHHHLWDLEGDVRYPWLKQADPHHSYMGDNSSLRRRLLDLVAGLTEATHLSPAVRMSGTVDNSVPPELAEHVEAVVREAVTNAVRHASATELSVLIDAGDDVVITVQDNGVGIPPDTARSGLRNLASRAAKFGGTLAVRATDGGGACVVWRVPLT